MLAAIKVLGEDAVVIEAKRVKRAGMLGRFGGEHVEVVARPKRALAPTAARRPEPVTPAPVAPAAAASFQGSLRRALSSRKELERLAAEARQADLFVDLTDPAEDEIVDLRTPPTENRAPAAPPSRLPSRFTADDLAPLPEPPPGVAPKATLTLSAPPPVPAGIAVAANPAVIDLRSHAQNRERAAKLAPPPPPPPPQQPMPVRSQSVIDLIGATADAPARWGRAELRSIGVPERVLDELPKADPVSDTVWSMALETAIWWTLRKHRPRTSLVVDGYGPEGAMALLEAVLEGHVIRYIHLGDRSVEANPRELAKAVRSCLPR